MARARDTLSNASTYAAKARAAADSARKKVAEAEQMECGVRDVRAAEAALRKALEAERGQREAFSQAARAAAAEQAVLQQRLVQCEGTADRCDRVAHLPVRSSAAALLTTALLLCLRVCCAALFVG